MDSLLLCVVKGCIGVGSLAIAVGLACDTCSEQECSVVTKYNFGVLTEVLALHVHRLKVVLDFYPCDKRLWKKLLLVTRQLGKQVAYGNSPKNMQRVLQIQRELFSVLDDIRLNFSESLAVEEIYQVTDDLKQVVTDVCLNSDV